MINCLHTVLGTSEAQQLYWNKNLQMSRKMICEAINSGRLLGRRTTPNGGYIVDKRSVDLDVTYVELTEATRTTYNEDIKTLEAIHLEDMQKYNDALNKGVELLTRKTLCKWCGSILSHDVECC